MSSQKSLKDGKESQENQRRVKDGNRGWNDVIANSKDERKGKKPRNAGSLKKVKKAKKQQSLWKEYSPIYALILAQCDPFWITDFQNCKIIHVCCF